MEKNRSLLMYLLE